MDWIQSPFIYVAEIASRTFKRFINTFIELSKFYRLVGNIIVNIPTIFKKSRFTFEQMLSLGVGSLPLVLIISTFTGGVAVSQARYQFANIVPLTYLGLAVCKSVVIELAPILTALVLAGRIGASIAAELGSMKTNEQIDALECLTLDPIVYLIVPRVVAGIIMFVVLTIFADLVAICGAWFVATLFLKVSSPLFIAGLKLFFSPMDIFAGLIKAAVFGGITTLMGCYHGLNADGGAEGVGKATMKAVVSSCVLVLIFDFIVAALLF